MNGSDGGPSGLGGWLVLPAIGLFLTPLKILAFLVSSFLPIFQDGTWEALTTPGMEMYHPLWGPLLIYEVVGNVAFVIFSVVLIFLFFGKHHRFPSLMIVYYLANVLFVALDYIFGNFIPYLADIDDAESLGEILGSVVAAGVWIPYFMVSKRVRNTFVKPGVDRRVVEAFD